MECSICYDKIENNDSIKLSCEHQLHKKCYVKLLYYNKNKFFKCPLCRVINRSIEKVYHEPKKNIEMFCSLPKRCVCSTKENKRCKNKPYLLNNGMCYQHNKEVLETSMYPVIEQYINFINTQRNNFSSRILLFDIGKKLLLKKNEIETLDQLLSYFHFYLSEKEIPTIINYDNLYEYYDIPKPDKKWYQDCLKKHIFY